jgi:hypothetical protein
MYKNDFGLSFAGEDCLHAQDLADRLRVDGINIFYDPDEEAELWGQDLDADVTDSYAIFRLLLHRRLLVQMPLGRRIFFGLRRVYVS